MLETLKKWLPWLNIWENQDENLLAQLQAEFGGHIALHALIPLLAYMLVGSVGFWVGCAASAIYALYKELIEDGHLEELKTLGLFSPWREWGGNLQDFYTDIFARLLPLPFLIILFLIVK